MGCCSRVDCVPHPTSTRSNTRRGLSPRTIRNSRPHPPVPAAERNTRPLRRHRGRYSRSTSKRRSSTASCEAIRSQTRSTIQYFKYSFVFPRAKRERRVCTGAGSAASLLTLSSHPNRQPTCTIGKETTRTKSSQRLKQELLRTVRAESYMRPNQI